MRSNQKYACFSKITKSRSSPLHTPVYFDLNNNPNKMYY